MPRISYQQIQQNISEIANREYYSPTIIYDLLLAYGKPKATVTKLQNGVNNFARHDGVLLKDAVFFKIFPAGTVLESKVEQLKHDDLDPFNKFPCRTKNRISRTVTQSSITRAHSRNLKRIDSRLRLL